MADATLNHTVAEVFAEDTEQLNRMVKLWTDAFKGAAMSEVQSIAKENTDTESSGVRYSVDEEKSIKEQIIDNLSLLSLMSPVAEVDYVPVDDAKLRSLANERFKNFGYKIDRPKFGIIEISDKQINNCLNYINTDAESAASFAVPYVLKRGIIIGNHDNHKVRSHDTITFAAPVIINGQRCNVAALVKITKGNRFKAVRVLTVSGQKFVLPKSKGTEATSAKMTAKSGESLAITSVPKVRITQSSEIVNPDSKNSLPETDSKGNELTEQQREYFKDSKIVQICQQQACTVSYLYHFIKKRLSEQFR